MWIAVLGFVKIFPNLEATGLGVFNRVLKFFRKTSTSFHRRVGWREKNARHSCASFQTHPLTQGQGSLMLSTPNNINDDIKGILSWNDRGAPPLRLRAYQPAHPVKLARWRVYAMRTDSTDNTSPKRHVCRVHANRSSHAARTPTTLAATRLHAAGSSAERHLS